MRLIIISGRSGSGKTVALHVLEDLGFYCIDNLPIALLPELERHIIGNEAMVALSIDARNIPSDLHHFKNIISSLHASGKNAEILYLDASENTLLKRYSETRRKHPLTNSKISLREAIRKEQELLTPIATLADLTVDTTLLSRQALQNLIRDRVSPKHGSRIQVLLHSFGFKHGLPPEADFVFDVRCLPNPYWESELRELTGRDDKVIEFLEEKADVQAMLQDIYHFLEQWIPRFEADNRSYLTVALGCTGGLHRSVFLVEQLAEKIKKIIPHAQVRHRELDINKR